MNLFTFHVHVAADNAAILELLNEVNERSHNMARTLDEVLQKVTQQGTELDGVRELIKGLRQQVKDALVSNPADQAKIDAIFAAAESNSAEIAEALAENVPNPNIPPVNPA